VMRIMFRRTYAASCSGERFSGFRESATAIVAAYPQIIDSLIEPSVDNCPVEYMPNFVANLVSCLEILRLYLCLHFRTRTSYVRLRSKRF